MNFSTVHRPKWCREKPFHECLTILVKSSVAIALLVALVVLLVSLHLNIIYVENNVIFTGDGKIALSLKTATDKNTANADMIPRRFHQMWRRTHVPVDYISFMESWKRLHPSFEFWFWTDADVQELIRRHFPEFLSIYFGYPDLQSQVNVARLFILYKYGGIFIDISLESVAPIGNLIEKKSCFVALEPTEHAVFFWNHEVIVSNSIMGCRERHPYIALILESLPLYRGYSVFPFIKRSNPAIESTGYVPLSDKFVEYGSNLFQEQYMTISTWPATYTFAGVDSVVMLHVRLVCTDAKKLFQLTQPQRALCEKHKDSNYGVQLFSSMTYVSRHYSFIKTTTVVPLPKVLTYFSMAHDRLKKMSD